MTPFITRREPLLDIHFVEVVMLTPPSTQRKRNASGKRPPTSSARGRWRTFRFARAARTV
jgi:hypothetical protein